jgi:hypothetical protein
MSSRRQHLLAMVLFAVVVVVVFQGAIFHGEVLAPLDLLSKELPWRAVLPATPHIGNFTQTDVAYEFHPWKHFVREEFQAGRFPLWCSRVGCGYPLAGNGVIKLFGLTTACLWVAPPRVAALLSFSAQLLIAMAGAYVLLRAMRLRWLSAVFGGLLYGLSSPMFQHLEFEHVVGGLMMLPWMCWALWHAASDDRGSLRWMALGGVFFGLAIINGSIQSAAIVGVAVAGFGFAAFRGEGRWRRGFVALCLLAVLGMVVGAVALLPNLELFRLNARPRFDRIDWWQLTWKRPVILLPWVLSALNPDAVGNYQTFDMLRGLGKFGTAATSPTMSDVRVYCGLAACALVWLGWRCADADRRVRSVGLWLVLVPLIAAVLTPLYLILYFRVLAACALGVAVLAALGVERLLARDERLKRDIAVCLVVLVAAVVAALALGVIVGTKRDALTRQCEEVGLRNTSVYKTEIEWQRQKARETVNNFTLRGPAVARFCLLAAVVGGALVATRRAPLVSAALLLAINSADLVEVGWRTLTSVPPSYEYPTTPALDFLRKQTGLFRVASSWIPEKQLRTAVPNTLMTQHLDDARIYESLFPANPLLAREDWSALNVRFFLVPPGADPPRGHWRRVYQGEVDIYENPDVMPRVYFVRDLARTTPAETTVAVGEYLSGDIRASVDAPAPGWIVVTELNYPGWQATVNGAPAAVALAAGQWLAVPVKAGKSEVRLTYRPASVHWGLVLSAAGLLTAGFLWSRYASASNASIIRRP